MKPGTWVRWKGEKYPAGRIEPSGSSGEFWQVGLFGGFSENQLLEEFEPAPLDPEAYEGCFCVAWGNGELVIEKLESSFVYDWHKIYVMASGQCYTKFTPCEIVPTNPELITPDKFLIFGPEGKVIQ